MDFVIDYAVDIVLLLIFVISVLHYTKKGFVRSLLEFLSFFAAVFVSMRFSQKAASFLAYKTDALNFNEARLISRIVIFVLVSACLNTAIYYIDKVFRLPVIKTANKLLGGILGALCGVILVITGVILIEILELSGNESVIQAAENSRIMDVSLKLIDKCSVAAVEYIQKGV